MNVTVQRPASEYKTFDLVKRSTVKLTECVQALEVLSASTEYQFLDIGTRLTSFYERSAKVSSLSGTVAGLLSGGDISGTIQGLTTVMEGFVLHLKQFDVLTGDSITKMDSISGRMEDIVWLLEDMDGITRMLGVLGFSVRLQNAMLKRPFEGMRLLGDDVKKLAADITERAGHMARDTQALTAVVGSSRSKIDQLSSDQQKKAARIYKSTRTNIAFLNEKYDLSAGSAAGISACSSEISQCIREIVTFIQFHDIMRQQFESSLDVFRKMTVTLEKASEEDELSNMVKSLAEFCIREGAPLQLTRADFISIVSSVMENLKVLSQSVNRLLSEVASLVRAGNAAAGSFLENIEESLSSVASTVAAFSESGMVKGEFSEATAVVTGMIEKMSGYTRDIEDIGDEIELMAFNAAVKAEQIGAEGRALSVVADEVQKISAQAQLCTASIARILKDVGPRAEELSFGVAEGEREYTLKVGGMSEKLSGHVAHLRDLNRRLLSAIGDIDETGKGLVGEIDRVITEISIHRDVDYVIGETLAFLGEIISDIFRTLPEMAEAGPLAHSFLPQLYDQRLEEEVKLLQSDKRAGPLRTGPEDLGDNIELF